MTGDYKYEIQKLADEFAENRYNRDFYACPGHVQDALYQEATTEYHERLMDHADWENDRIQDRWANV
jgi:hypothetical protein